MFSLFGWGGGQDCDRFNPTMGTILRYRVKLVARDSCSQDIAKILATNMATKARVLKRKNSQDVAKM